VVWQVITSLSEELATFIFKLHVYGKPSVESTTEREGGTEDESEPVMSKEDSVKNSAP
jgi:hypothetical protein